MRQQQKTRTITSKYYIEGSFIIKIKIGDIMFDSFIQIYHNLTGFYGIFDDSIYNNTINRAHIDGWKDNYSKLSVVSIVRHGCAVSPFPQFCDKALKF